MFFWASAGRRDGASQKTQSIVQKRLDGVSLADFPSTLKAEGEGQESDLATSTLLKGDPMYILLGTPVPEPPSLLLQETLNPTSPIHLQPPPQDGLNEAAGQMDKLDAKVGVGPEASRRPGKEPQCFLETNKHMDSHTTQRK